MVWYRKLITETCPIIVKSVIGVDSALRNNGKKAIKNMMTFGFVRLTAKAWRKQDQLPFFGEISDGLFVADLHKSFKPIQHK